MQTLNNLTKTTTKSTKRLGRGIGSGVGGHTTGRGAKGDKARGKNKLTFDGSKIKKSWIKRTPFLKGKHRVLAQAQETIISLDLIAKYFDDQAVITPLLLTQKSHQAGPFKILAAKNKFAKIVTLKGFLISANAAAQIVKAGGKIEA